MLNSNFRLKSDLHAQLNINDIIYRTLFTEAHMVPANEAILYSV